jgi:hypothetical protein
LISIKAGRFGWLAAALISFDFFDFCRGKTQQNQWPFDFSAL